MREDIIANGRPGRLFLLVEDFAVPGAPVVYLGPRSSEVGISTKRRTLATGGALERYFPFRSFESCSGQLDCQQVALAAC